MSPISVQPSTILPPKGQNPIPTIFATIIIRHNIHFHFPLAARIDFPFKTLPSDSGNFGTLCGLKLTPATPAQFWLLLFADFLLLI